MSLLSLPTEILTSIILLLDIPSTFRCQRVCKRLRRVADDESIFRELCIKARYLKPEETLEDLAKPFCSYRITEDGHQTTAYTHSAWELTGRHKDELKSYKSLLVGSWKLDWEKDYGDLSFAGGTNRSDESAPSSIRIDHTRDLIIASSPHLSCAQVIDMHTGSTTLIDDDLSYDSEQCDYDQGWRVCILSNGDLCVACDERYEFIGKETEREVLIRPKHRGALAFRLKFPNFLVASSRHLTTYNITTKQVIQDMRLDQTEKLRGLHIRQVDFDDDFVWLCWQCQDEMSAVIHAYCRQTDKLSWRLDTESWPISLATTYLFSPATSTTATGSGREEQEVRQAIDDEGEDGLGTAQWEAVYPDYMTGCLCLVADYDLIVVPKYKDLPSNWTDEESPAVNSLIILRDIGRKSTPILPSWIARDSEPHQPCLSVADGRAAFRSENGVALVDLQKLLDYHRDSCNPADDPRGVPRHVAGETPYSFVNVWTSPHVFGSSTFRMCCLTLTATCLAWAGTYQSISVWRTPEELRKYGPEEIYPSKQWPVVIWVDFAKLRNREVDTRRKQAEEQRSIILQKCEAEMERRIAATGDDQYPFRTGAKIKSIKKDVKDPKDLVTLLLNVREFGQLKRWIDWDAVRSEGGEHSELALSQRVSLWEHAMLAQDYRQRFLRPMDYLRLAPAVGGGDDALHDYVDYDDLADYTLDEDEMDFGEDDMDLQMMAAGMPPMSAMSESFQDFFGGQGMDAFGGWHGDDGDEWDDY